MITADCANKTQELEGDLLKYLAERLCRVNRLRVPTKDDPCVVCGSVPTIKSHLIPRAVVGELRGDEPYVHVTEVDVPGSVYSQSGDSFYGLLCSEHERALSRFDDYGVRIVRKIEKLMSQMGEDQKGIELQNSSPSLFKGFVLACIWRAVCSLHGKKFGLSLGPYEKRIRRFLFEDEEFEAPTWVSTTPLVLEGQDRMPMIVMPHRRKMDQRNCWHIVINKVAIYTIIDSRPPDSRLDAGRIDKQLLVLVPHLEPLHLFDWLPWKRFFR